MSNEMSEKISVLTERIDNLMERLDRLEEVAEKRFVTNVEFWPVRTLVYGCTGVVLLAVVSTAVALVVRISG